MTFYTALYILRKNSELLNKLHLKFLVEMSVVHESGFFKGCVKNSNFIKALYYHEISNRLVAENQELLQIMKGTS